MKLDTPSNASCPTLVEPLSRVLPSAMAPIFLTRGEVLFRRGEYGAHLFVVTSGVLKLTRRTRAGGDVILDVFGPGEMFGELAAFAPGPWTATAQAVTDVAVLSCGAAEVAAWAIAEPEAARALLVSLAERLRARQRSADDRVTADVPGRVAQVLLRLADGFGVKRGSVTWIDHGLSQEELAKMVGANRRTVNQALSRFSTRGWVQVERRRVVLLDSVALAKIAGPERP